MLSRLVSLVTALVLAGATAGCLRVVEANSSKEASDAGKLAFEGRRKVHKGLWGDYGGQSITESLSGTTGDVVITRGHDPGYRVGPVNPPAYPPYPLTEMSCNANAVVVGTAGEATSGLIQGDAFLYSDFEFLVQEVIKDNKEAPIKPAATIIVTRPGGTLTIKGRTIRAVDPDFKEFRRGRRYLLFLRFVPETGAYEATAEDGFELLDNRVQGLTQSPYWPDLETDDPATLLNAARDAVEGAHGCTGR